MALFQADEHHVLADSIQHAVSPRPGCGHPPHIGTAVSAGNAAPVVADGQLAQHPDSSPLHLHDARHIGPVGIIRAADAGGRGMCEKKFSCGCTDSML